MKPFVRMLQRPEVAELDRVARIRLERSSDIGGCLLSDEDVLRERADDPAARNKRSFGAIELTDDEIRWLHEATGELLAHMKDEQ